MNVVLINPASVHLRADPWTTGIPYMPVSLAYAAAAIRAQGACVQVVDAFGENPLQYTLQDRFVVRGLTPRQVLEKVPASGHLLVLYAGGLIHHRSLMAMLRFLRKEKPDLPIAVMENTQAVTAYSLRQLMPQLWDAGATYILCGEPEIRLTALLNCLKNRLPPEGIDGIGWRDSKGEHFVPPSARWDPDVDSTPFPAWELFPLRNYWSLRYAHGPLEEGRYLPLLTSRGCPYRCRFCVIPETTRARWRGRSAHHVVEEMAYWKRTLSVREFHLEDVNPTVEDHRIREISRLLVESKLDVIWKISAGTKVETIKSQETIKWMARSGCRYVSISPESGSPEVLRRIGKPFDVEHALRIIRWLGRSGIRSQCCFVLGFPGEGQEDRRMTWRMVRRFVQAGVDEIALFIVTPVPGSEIFDQFTGFQDFSELNFSPMWRSDFHSLHRFRLRLYGAFLFWKLCFHPWKMLAQPFRFVLRRFFTKMEMAPYRVLHTTIMHLGLIGRRVSWERTW